MIPIHLTTALALYSGILFFLAIAIWVYTEIAVWRSQRVLEKQFLWRCVFCGYTYLDEEAEDVSRCPRCGSYNSVTDKHARAVPPRHRAEHEAEKASDTERPRRNPSVRKRPHQRRRGPRKRG